MLWPLRYKSAIRGSFVFFMLSMAQLFSSSIAQAHFNAENAEDPWQGRRTLCYRLSEDVKSSNNWPKWIKTAIDNWNKANKDAGTGWKFVECTGDGKADFDFQFVQADPAAIDARLRGKSYGVDASGTGVPIDSSLAIQSIKIVRDMQKFQTNGKLVQGGQLGWGVQDGPNGQPLLDPVLVVMHELTHIMRLEHSDASCLKSDTEGKGDLETPVCPGDHNNPKNYTPTAVTLAEVKRSADSGKKTALRTRIRSQKRSVFTPTLRDPTPQGGEPVSFDGGYVGMGVGRTRMSGDWTTNEVVSLGAPDPLVDETKDLAATRAAWAVYLGYMWLGAPEWLAGIEADWVYDDVFMDPGIPGTGAIGTSAARANDSVSVRSRWGFSVRARVGRMLTPATMIYATAGPSWRNVEASVNCAAAGVCGTNGIPAFTQTNSAFVTGWTVGGGLEAKMFGGLRGRVEYRYSSYGAFATNFGTPSNLAVAANIKLHSSAAMFGLSYSLGTDLADRTYH
jgi:outer membrane immunogenic protein